MLRVIGPTLFCLIGVWRPWRPILTRITWTSNIWNILMTAYLIFSINKSLPDLSSVSASQDSFWPLIGEGGGRGMGDWGLRGPSWDGDKDSWSGGERRGDIRDASPNDEFCSLICWGLDNVDKWFWVLTRMFCADEEARVRLSPATPDRHRDGDDIIGSGEDIIGEPKIRHCINYRL